MCGIFGIIANKEAGFTYNVTKPIVDRLFTLSESRGKEASGIAILTQQVIQVIKSPMPASAFIQTPEYQELLEVVFSGNGQPDTRQHEEQDSSFAIIGHSRLVTNGSHQIHENNQPVIAAEIVGIHNGIITNVDQLWRHFSDLERKYEIDTEILLRLVRKFFEETGDLGAAVQKVYTLIEGAASIALLFSELHSILLATNTGSLYVYSAQNNTYHIFASERWILQKLIQKTPLPHIKKECKIRHIEANSGYIVDLKHLNSQHFLLHSNGHEHSVPISSLTSRRLIRDVSSQQSYKQHHVPGQGPYILPSSFNDDYPRNQERIKTLRRCTKCILPETMPFIEFDEQGVCNFCHHHTPLEYRGLDALLQTIAPYRRSDGQPDCLVTFSGGRDSSYGVHIVKTVLNMNPVTYTYDWGMVTDLARRNQMRLCGKLGIEHILVSADIAKKRSNIRKNVLAWLKKPDLGTIPLFMAGDKQYFYYANKIGKQTGCQMIILCENPLETTRFKSGFCGIAPDHRGRQTFKLRLIDKIKLAQYYGKQCLTNPAYLNSSLLDTLGAYCSYYFIPHNYFDIYQYIKWDEAEIISTLRTEYNWETAVDTSSTWRIGDGTASFYNYIYYTMAGFTENDTFRSNQIRENIISRQDALELVEKENAPRYASIQWYCDIIGIDFEETIKIINAAPKLY
ncbi:putative lipopolysaccharide biosynthesis protein [Candidatus Vecturithrix granuli]|uniref:Glutamine--fructose-6-phosphate aminotransferase [isomerizing] n=1 Tax=Vecturithrix granuli TaxID=1499967 RepID=A0A081BZZ3_VECG1|nr:putative lipopolysaccharide biosynthesis protein [Candidatus Vecturithrix granuli]